ncbi:MAG: NAD(P)-dependent oxidoreductase [Candidatus Marinimicrobia bacterium]|nr:NAD(P)-dependent oxidoreductase [Candidatus Neomarinimicrobiota bacterium]
MAIMKILVLGGNGFVGKNIVEYLSHNNSYKVLSPGRAMLNLLDTTSVQKYMEAEHPDVVIHSAVDIQSVENNLQMYFNIDRCSGQYGKLITIGSGAEYDMRNYHPLMSESYFRTHIPADTYGLSKFVVAHDVKFSNKRAVNLRGYGIYGKYEDYTRRFISNNICKAICGLDVSLFMNMRFDYLYVNDFVRILELFITQEPRHKNYNICTSRPHELLEMAEMVREIHDDPNTGLVVRQAGMKPEYSGDNSRFIEEFGPFEFTDMKQSIEELYQWYKDEVDLTDYCLEQCVAEQG